MRRAAIVFCTLLAVRASAAQTSTGFASKSACEVYDYRIAAPDGKNTAAYLWVPAEARVIRAVMVGIQNGLPATILQDRAVRKMCEGYGIAQVPGADPRPIRITVAACQPALWQPDGFRAAHTVYQSFVLTP